MRYGHALPLAALCVVAVVLAACSQDANPTSPSAPARSTAPVASAAATSADEPAPPDMAVAMEQGQGQNTLAVCHLMGNGTTREIYVNPNAEDAHLGHGDFLPLTFYADADGDGFGAGAPQTGCVVPAGFVEDDTDCDDGDDNVYPGNTEVCDGKDNNCNGDTDEGVLSTFYADTDGDTFGDANASTLACSVPDGFVENMTDCDDANGAVNPGEDEVCNGVDDNCSGIVDGEVQAGDLCAACPCDFSTVALDALFAAAEPNPFGCQDTLNETVIHVVERSPAPVFETGPGSAAFVVWRSGGPAAISQCQTTELDANRTPTILQNETQFSRDEAEACYDDLAAYRLLRGICGG